LRLLCDSSREHRRTIGVLKAFSITDIGRKRQLNEDYVFETTESIGLLPNLFLVADGMGGHKAGDHASRETVEIMVEQIGICKLEDRKEILRSALEAANQRVYADARHSVELEGMGTTVVAATLDKERLLVMNVGDSRLYVVSQEGIRQITVDHSLVEEMVRKGVLTKEKARIHPKKNIITKAVGVMASVEPDFFELELKSGDRILLCSDGLSNMLEDEEISMIVNSVGPLEEKAKMLVDAANGNGGKDNISVILVESQAEA